MKSSCLRREGKKYSQNTQDNVYVPPVALTAMVNLPLLHVSVKRKAALSAYRLLWTQVILKLIQMESMIMPTDSIPVTRDFVTLFGVVFNKCQTRDDKNTLDSKTGFWKVDLCSSSQSPQAESLRSAYTRVLKKRHIWRQVYVLSSFAIFLVWV